ncbi:MAG: DNA polymerase III subunit alpha [Acidobacteriia bacterium]|nr:DNA polymerase III subunit alpha [Terriglobia bacterium]
MFTHLHCHSHYSFLRGVGSPEELVAAAAEQKMPAVALTDTDGLYAAVPFYQAARKAGVKPVVGTALEAALPIPKTETRNSKCEMRDAACVPLVLLAANAEGYGNLCRLVTQRQLSGAAVPLDVLAQHNAGVIAIAGSHPALSENARLKPGATKSSLHESRVTSHQSPAASPQALLKEIYGDALYLEVRMLGPGDGRALRAAERLGRELGVPLVATNNVHFLRAEEHLHHRVVNAIRTGGLLTTVGPPEITSGEAWFKPAAEMERLFAEQPGGAQALRATEEIAERANLQLELGRTIFPEFPVPQGETPFSYLWKLSFAGAQRRYDFTPDREAVNPLRPEVLARLTHELEVIEKLGLAPYFLLVWDIAREARARGIPAVARGSAASSIVTYCLEISSVCPLRWGLYFERFLNEQRGDCPDIDLDICGARRDELLEYVYRRWGAEHVAMIGSFITMQARLAIREVAKVFGVAPGEVRQFTGKLPHRPVREIRAAIAALPQCRHLPVNDEPWRTILEVAERLDETPRHLGIHPCGTVIAAQPLTQLAPLERAAKGIVVTQYDMNAVEALGLIKMDLLGQRGLTTMSLALANIEQTRAERIDFAAIPENDPATCAMLAAGRTLGVFQIESPGMRGLLRTMRARTLEEIAAALALIRPGASEYGSKELFLKRLRGEEPVAYAHPSLKEILGDTLGVCIYQEQVMRIAQAVGNMSLAEADIVRRSAAKFSGLRERERLRAKFLKAAERMGLAGKAREETWQMVEKFAGFGFCKAHAAAYADLSYRMAYLKAHHPAEFLAAMCSAGAGFYHVSAYVEEAKRWGITVRLPSVNHSRREYTAEARAGEKTEMRVGLMQVRGLRGETIAAILRERETGGAFRSLEEFLRRVPLERDELEALVKCGALDEVCAMTRPEMLWRWNLLRKNGGLLPAAPGLFAGAQEEDGLAPPEMRAAEYTAEHKLRYEREILEVCVSGHPLDFFPRNGEVWSDALEELRGKRAELCGWLVTYRQVGTKNRRNMMFLTLEDQRGLFEAVLFPGVYERYGGLAFETRALRVSGRVEPGGLIRCERLEALR